MLARAELLHAENVPLVDALGRVLADDVVATTPLPSFDHSAMDGYAIRCSDLSGAAPFRLPVRGESRAGGPAASWLPGSACRIFTGAPLPPGTDTVIIQEDVQRSEHDIQFELPPAPGQHVRRRGDDLAEGAVALRSGTRLGPAHIGLLATLDQAEARVTARPQVTILCTGDELRAPGSPATPGTIPESNGVMLAALARLAGAVPTIAPRVGDDRVRTRAALEQALTNTDLLVTVGGVSVGDYDVVQQTLRELGAQLEFWKVRLKPGKPLLWCTLGRTLVLGLPGNPVSAQITFGLFGMPLLRKMQGDARPVPPSHRARLLSAIRQKPGRRGYYRAVLEGDGVRPLANQASGALTSLAWADALVIADADVSELQPGALVEVIRLADL